MTHVQKFWTLQTLPKATADMIDPKSLQTLKSWLKGNSSIPTFITDEQIVLFLLSCYGNVQETKNCIESYYRLRSDTPQFFKSRDIHTPPLKKALSVLYYGILPERTPEGYIIVFHMLRDNKPFNYAFNEGFKLLMMLIDGINAKEGPQDGLIMLFDMKGVKLGHVIKLPLYSVRKSLEYIQDAVPVRLKSIHVLNVHSLIDKIMLLVKPFLRKQFLDLLHFHKENDEEVFKAIPKRCLPQNYGGQLETIDFYHHKFMEEMETLRPLFLEESILFYRESKKAKDKSDDESMPNAADLSIQEKISGQQSPS